MELVFKKQDNKIVMDTKEMKRPDGVKTLNINHVLHGLKQVHEETSFLNGMILTVKTVQIITVYNPEVTEEMNYLTEKLYNEFEIAYNIYFEGIGGAFNFLNTYSLMELLLCMNISKEASLMLLTSLAMCNDIKFNYGSHDDRNFLLRYVQKEFISEIINENVYLIALVSLK